MSFNLPSSNNGRINTNANDTLLSTDSVLTCNRAGAVGIALPALAGVRGRTFTIRNQDNTAAVTLTPNGAETINGVGTLVVAVGVLFTKPSCVIYAPPTGTDWMVLGLTPL